LSLYSHTQDTYYYYCWCCSGGYVFAPSKFQYVPPYPTCSTNKSACIGTGCSSFSPDYKRVNYPPNVFCGFLLDPDAKDKNGIYHAGIYKDGITPSRPKDLKIELGKDASLDTTTNVKYYYGKDRYVVLHDIIYLRLPPLHIGFEVSADPGGTVPPDQVQPCPLSLPYGQLVYINNKCYLVAIGK
jgi:hypothetical protein